MKKQKGAIKVDEREIQFADIWNEKKELYGFYRIKKIMEG